MNDRFQRLTTWVLTTTSSRGGDHDMQLLIQFRFMDHQTSSAGQISIFGGKEAHEGRTGGIARRLS